MATYRSPSAGITVGDLIYQAFTTAHDKPAFVMDDRTLSYAESARIVFSLARALRDLGIGPGDGVALLMPNKPETYLLRAAIKLINGRYTPLNALSKPSEWSYVLDDSEVKLFVHDPTLTNVGPDFLDSVTTPLVRQACGAAPDDLLRVAEGCDGTPFRAVGDEEDIYGLIYTGGTTGRPKGVMIPHRARVQQVMMKLSEYALHADTRILLSAPISHGAGSLILPTLLRGGTVHLMEKFNPAKFIEIVETQRINTGWGVPTMVSALVNCPEIRTADVSSLQTFIYSGAPITPTLLAEAMKVFGPIFIQHYGQTEAPGIVSVLGKKDHDLARPELLSSCGRPVPGNSVSIRNDDDEEVPTNEMGEICVRGRLVSAGYWKKEEQTKETYRAGWLRTGDIGRIDPEGYLYITDRKKDMIISGGFNVYPREVEDAVARHPSVKTCAVVGLPDPHWGEVVTALVVVRDGEERDETELTRFLKDSLGSVKSPKKICFATELPTTPNGKVDKVTVRQRLAAELG